MKLSVLQQRRLVKAFQQMILALDHGRCRNPNCIGSSYERGILSAHHIKLKSHGVDHSAENGILLCKGCDHAVHHGHGKRDERLSAREFMLQILNDLVDDPEYRWHAAHQVLRDRYETTNERNMMPETTEAKRVDSDMFAVYDSGDGTLLIDHPDADGVLVPTAVKSLPIPKQLTGMAFAIRNLEVDRDRQLAILKDQQDTIKMHIEAVNERAVHAIDSLKKMGSGLLDQLHGQGLAGTDAKKRPRLAIAGCGAWVTNTTQRASYDAKGWNDMDEDQQAEVALANKHLFKITQVPAREDVKPDRPAIIRALLRGDTVDGFAFIAEADSVVFKSEKGTGLPPVGMRETVDQAGG